VTTPVSETFWVTGDDTRSLATPRIANSLLGVGHHPHETGYRLLLRPNKSRASAVAQRARALAVSWSAKVTGTKRRNLLETCRLFCNSAANVVISNACKRRLQWPGLYARPWQMVGGSVIMRRGGLLRHGPRRTERVSLLGEFDHDDK
jgi:hypothetical protein